MLVPGRALLAQGRGGVDRGTQGLNDSTLFRGPVCSENRGLHGEVPERLNGLVSKTSSGFILTRGFESPPLRFPQPLPLQGLLS